MNTVTRQEKEFCDKMQTKPIRQNEEHRNRQTKRFAKNKKDRQEGLTNRQICSNEGNEQKLYIANLDHNVLESKKETWSRCKKVLYP